MQMIRPASPSRRFGRTTTRRTVDTGGVDPMEIARRAGHSSVVFTYDRYGDLFPEVDVGAAAKLEALRNIGALIGAEVY